MVRATHPWEYLHADFVEMPKASDGMEWLLIIVDDLSLTTLLHPCTSCTTEVFVDAFINHWLAHHPDPVLLHTDGGTHFDNAVVRGIAQACELQHNISTAYAKWAHGVAERMNKAVLQILRPLLRGLGRTVSQWPGVIKFVQRALQRKRRPSRNNMSPLQITTGIAPRDAMSLLVSEGLDIRRIDGDASTLLDDTVAEMAALLESHWELADTARRAKSEENRRRTDLTALPSIALGDYVLYAQYIRDTKLDYKWRGPAQVIHRVNPQIYIVDPVGLEHVRPFAVHVSLLRRFASSQLDVTEQLTEEIRRDHPDNVVQKLVAHKHHDGNLWLQVRWLGFTAERDTWQQATLLAESCPDRVLEYYRRANTERTPELIAFIRTTFPTADDEARLMQPVRQRRHFRRKTTHRTHPIPVITTPANVDGDVAAAVVTPLTTRTNGPTRRTATATRARRGRPRTRGRGRPRGRGRGRPERTQRILSARTTRARTPSPRRSTTLTTEHTGVKQRRRRTRSQQPAAKTRMSRPSVSTARPRRTRSTRARTGTATAQPTLSSAIESVADELARTKVELAAAAAFTETARTLHEQHPYNLRQRQPRQHRNVPADDIFHGMQMIPFDTTQ